MKWTKTKVEDLKDLCLCGVSNAEIAYKLGIDIKDVYAKRSQLGITIAKCREQPITPKNAGLNTAIRAAFGRLYNDLLIAVARDGISEKRANVYSTLYDDLLDLENKYEKLLRRE